MPPLRFALVVALSLVLAGCGVPDIVAHGVKSYERSQQAGGDNTAPSSRQPPAAQSAPAAAPSARSDAASDSGFVPEPAPQRETVTSEPLR